MINFSKKTKLVIFFLIIIGTLLRFYNLNWGSPFYFHPDERNIASSVSQLNFPEQMNPHFFAYGSFPIYSIYATGIFINAIMNLANNQNTELNKVSFENAIIISRFYSAFFSVIIIGLMYRLGKVLRNKSTGIVAAFFTTTSIGLIQFSHFGTFEIWLSYCSTLLFLALIRYLKSKNLKYFILSSFIFGLLLSIKVSSAVLFIFPILTLIFVLKKKNVLFSKKFFASFFYGFFLLTTFSFFTWIITSPYNLLDFSSFKNSINYESSVVLGTLKVFYTGGFYNTMPVLFQFAKIYPFLLNPFLTLLFIPSFIYLSMNSIKTKNFTYLILNIFFLILFFSQALFFAKWTRNMVPALVFIYLICSIAIIDFLFFIKKINKNLIMPLILFIFSISFTWTFSFFIDTYVNKDTRISAVEFARKNISQNSKILSEVYDLGIIPFNPNFPKIDLFNFYDLDNGAIDNDFELLNNLKNYDYIILPSQRILKSRVLNPEIFPNGHRFYKDLFTEKLGFKKIYETPCDIFCKITYMGNPVFSYEETASVFDRPSIFIFKKSQNSNIKSQINN